MCSDTRETEELPFPHFAEVPMIEIVTGDPRPIFRQIVDGLRRKIAGGTLPPGSRLPSVRGLALELHISLNTVAKAYTQLTAEGLIESRKGVGVFVCEPKQVLSDAERGRRLDEALERFVDETLSLGFSRQELLMRLRGELDRLSNDKPTDPESP